LAGGCGEIVPAATKRTIKIAVYFIANYRTFRKSETQKFLAAPRQSGWPLGAAVPHYFIEGTGFSCDLWLDLV